MEQSVPWDVECNLDARGSLRRSGPTLFLRTTPRNMSTDPTSTILLRTVERGDLPRLYELQLDARSNQMAGTKAWDADAFQKIWDGILADPTVTARAIIASGTLVGTISCFKRAGVDEVGYWIDRAWWGRGVASAALALLIREVTARPLHATARADNAGSIRVLERCGFRQVSSSIGEETPRYTAGALVHFVLD